MPEPVKFPVWEPKAQCNINILVDSEDIDRIKEFDWHFDKGYVYRTKRPRLKLTNFLMKISDKYIYIKQRDKDRLNYQKANLRIYLDPHFEIRIKKLDDGSRVLEYRQWSN